MVDPFKASYGVQRPLYAVVQLAQTTMRSEIGRLSLDNTFQERDRLNTNIVVRCRRDGRRKGTPCRRVAHVPVQPIQSQSASRLVSECELSVS